MTPHAIRPDPQTPTRIQMKIRRVTPELAAEWLEKNTRNRPVRRPYVRELVRELEEGRWKVTHQGVAFSAKGDLLDGQHRLHAIVESGVTAEMPVATNVPEEAWDGIDQHLKRTGAQILAMHGVSKDAPRLAAMARTILACVHEQPRVSNTAVAEYVVAHQRELEPFLPVARQFTPAVAAAFAWCLTLGWKEVRHAAERLVSTIWEEPQGEDPMRALHQRAKEFSRLGQGQAGIKARFDVALTALQAVHEKRGLKVVRGSSRVSYADFEAAPKTGTRATVAAKSKPIPAKTKAPSSAVGLKKIEIDDETAREIERAAANALKNRPAKTGKAAKK